MPSENEKKFGDIVTGVVVGAVLCPAVMLNVLIGFGLVALAGMTVCKAVDGQKPKARARNAGITEEEFASMSPERRLAVIRAGKAPPVGLERILKLDPQMSNCVYVSPEKLALLPDKQLTPADMHSLPYAVRTIAFEAGVIPQSTLHRL